MSKQSKAKAEQGYQAKAVPRVCATCAWYRSDVSELTTSYGARYLVEKNRRCGVGGFKVRKKAVCNRWQDKAGALDVPGPVVG